MDIGGIVMPLFDGFDDDTGRDIGPLETTTKRIVAALEESHPEPDPIRDGLCQAMLSLARNIDVQNGKGREISRNMGQYIDALWKIRDMYPVEVKADEDVEAVWAGDEQADES